MNSIHSPDPDNSPAHPEPPKNQKTNGASMSSPIQNTSIFTPGLVHLELAILAVYPLTVLLGIISNHPPESYFAKKTNLINLFFLKFGWAWTTIAFIPHLSRLPQKVAPSVRYAAATIWWYVVTQWCFGPPIMDKVHPFLISGIDRVGVSRNGGDLSNCEGRGLSRYIHFGSVSIERRRLERRS
jgi:Inositol phospholipid synthesis and fat-storage-inducing TM